MIKKSGSLPHTRTNYAQVGGNNIQTDSFDSSDAASSTNGLYVAGWHRANGDIASDASITNSVNVGNANIFGHVSTGPNGTVAIGANGSVVART